MKTKAPAVPSTFRALLRAELMQRCARNPRYSLRAFARHLDLAHATLSQLLRGERQVTRATILKLGKKLGLDEASAAALADADDGAGRDGAKPQPGPGALAAQIAEDPAHLLFLALVASRELPADTRRIARALDLSVDQANVILHRLTALGLLALEGAGAFRDVHNLGALPAGAFVHAVWRRAAALIQQADIASIPPPTQEEKPMSSPVAQFQILSKDPERASRFYGAVFGWTVDDANALGYRQVSTGPAGLAGGIWPAPPGAHPFVQLFVAVEDVAAAIDRARAQGARVLVPHQRLPDGDELAILADPEGISFGLMLRRSQ